MMLQPNQGKETLADRKGYPIFNRCRSCGYIITLSPETSKRSAHTRRFFNPQCSDCSQVSNWARIHVEEGSRQLFRDPRDARSQVTRLQDQGVPAILEHLGDSEYYVISYRRLQAVQEVCPEGFKEFCIRPDGSTCEWYRDGVCIKVRGEMEG